MLRREVVSAARSYNEVRDGRGPLGGPHEPGRDPRTWLRRADGVAYSANHYPLALRGEAYPRARQGAGVGHSGVQEGHPWRGGRGEKGRGAYGRGGWGRRTHPPPAGRNRPGGGPYRARC